MGMAYSLGARNWWHHQFLLIVFRFTKGTRERSLFVGRPPWRERSFVACFLWNFCTQPGEKHKHTPNHWLEVCEKGGLLRCLYDVLLRLITHFVIYFSPRHELVLVARALQTFAAQNAAQMHEGVGVERTRVDLQWLYNKQSCKSAGKKKLFIPGYTSEFFQSL